MNLKSMFSKDEKKALTRLALLSIGWPVGLDRFYDGKNKDGILTLIGWSIIFACIMILAPCPSHMQSADTMLATKGFTQANPLVILPLGLGVYGGFLVIRKGFRLLRQFESAES